MNKSSLSLSLPLSFTHTHTYIYTPCVKEMTGRNRAAQLEIVKQMSRQ